MFLGIDGVMDDGWFCKSILMPNFHRSDILFTKKRNGFARLGLVGRSHVCTVIEDEEEMVSSGRPN